MGEPASILLVRLRQIGDVVFTTPAVRALRRRFPDAHITYLVEPAAAPIVAGNPHLDEVIVAPRRPGIGGLVADLALVRRLRARRFDLAIDFHGGPRASLLTWLSGAPVRIGYDVAGRSWMYTHARGAAARAARRGTRSRTSGICSPRSTSRRPTRHAHPVEMPARSRRRRGRRRAARARRASRPTIGWSSCTSAPATRSGAGRSSISRAGRRRSWPTTPRAASSSPRGRRSEAAAARVIAAARDRARRRGGDARAVVRRVLAGRAARAARSRGALHRRRQRPDAHRRDDAPCRSSALYGPTLPARSAPWRGPACADRVGRDRRPAVPAVRPARLRAGRLPVPDVDQPQQVVDAARRAVTRPRPLARRSGVQPDVSRSA